MLSWPVKIELNLLSSNLSLIVCKRSFSKSSIYIPFAEERAWVGDSMSDGTMGC